MISQQGRSRLEPRSHGSFAAASLHLVGLQPVAFTRLWTNRAGTSLHIGRRMEEKTESGESSVCFSWWYCLYLSPSLNNSVKLNTATFGQESQTLHGSAEGAWIIQGYMRFNFVNPAETKGFSYLIPCHSGDLIVYFPTRIHGSSVCLMIQTQQVGIAGWPGLSVGVKGCAEQR